MGQREAAQTQANELETVKESRADVLEPEVSFIPLRADIDGSVIVDSDLDGVLESGVTTNSRSQCRRGRRLAQRR